MTMKKLKSKGFMSLIAFLALTAVFVLPQSVFAAITATVTGDTTVKLEWSGTGSAPYKLSREGTQIYSGSATSYTDTGLSYSTGYKYTLEYQNYEKTGGGYYANGSYWGVVTPAHYATRQEYQLITPGHYETREKLIPWCSGTVNGVKYEHSPPCQYAGNETTKVVQERVWVPDQYGWVTVTYIVPDEYGWIPYSYWVPETYGYVARTTTVTSGPVMGSVPSATIVTPANGQWLADKVIPRILVSDQDGDTLTSSYFIDGETSARESRTVSNTATAQEIAFSSLNLDSLAEGKHTLKVSISDGHYAAVVKTVDFYVDRTNPVIGNVAISSTDTSMTVSASATDTGAGLHALPYRYTVGTTAGDWTNQAHTFPQLSPNKEYAVQVEARDALGHIATRQQKYYTKSQVPSVSVTGSAETTIGIRINDQNPASTLYQIKIGNAYLDANGNLSDAPVSFSLSNKQMTAKGLQSGTVYSIQAAALNADGTTAGWGATVIGTTLSSAPADIQSARTQTSITLSWPAVRGASRYEIEVDGTVIDNGQALTYTHANLTPDTRHFYRVRSINAGGIGPWSAELDVFSLPNPPEIPDGLTPSYEQTYVTLSWNPAARAESYEVEADGIIMDAGNSLTYKHSGLEPESRHTYRVRARNIGGIGDWSAPLSVTTWPVPPPTPGNVVAKPLIRTITVTWEPSEKATGYEIEADGFIIDNGTETSYTDQGLEPLTGHTYRVRAKNIGGKSVWSDPVDVTTHPEIPTAPVNLIATSEETSITLTWYKVLNTESYDVEIDGAEIVNVTDNALIQTDLPSESAHTYRVRAKNISGDSPWSSPVKMATLPHAGNTALALTNVAAIVTNTFITLSWDTVAPNALYDVEVDGEITDNGDNTIFNHMGLKANEFHTYRIRLKDRESTGDWVAVLSLSTLPNPPTAPGKATAFPTTQSIELRWDKVDGATSYDIEIDGKTVVSGDREMYVHEGLTPGTSHTYRIRAKNETGVTAWSPSIVQNTKNPSYLLDSAAGKEVELTLFAYNVQDFSELTYVVTYNPNELDVSDLYQFTPLADLSSGKIPGSPLTVTFEPGKITYKVTRNIVPGTSWSGEIATVVFKSKHNGRSAVEVVVDSSK